MLRQHCPRNLRGDSTPPFPAFTSTAGMAQPVAPAFLRLPGHRAALSIRLPNASSSASGWWCWGAVAETLTQSRGPAVFRGVQQFSVLLLLVGVLSPAGSASGQGAEPGGERSRQSPSPTHGAEVAAQGRGAGCSRRSGFLRLRASLRCEGATPGFVSVALARGPPGSRLELPVHLGTDLGIARVRPSVRVRAQMERLQGVWGESCPAPCGRGDPGSTEKAFAPRLPLAV